MALFTIGAGDDRIYDVSCTVMNKPFKERKGLGQTEAVGTAPKRVNGGIYEIYQQF